MIEITIQVRTDVLHSWLKVMGYTQSRLAGELHVSKGRVSQLLSVKHKPSTHLIAKLMLLTDLPFERLFKVIPETTRRQRRNGNVRHVVLAKLSGGGV